MTDQVMHSDKLLSAGPTMVPCCEAERIAREIFGIDAHAVLLSSERDGNFRMRAAGGRDYLLKITNPQEDAAVTNLQTAALRHLEMHAPSLPVPRIVATKDGLDEVSLALANGRRHVVRLMSFLPGRTLDVVGRQAAFRAGLANMLATLDLGLREFDHAAACHDLLWDVTRAGRVRPLLGSVEDKTRRDLATRSLDEYERHAVPHLATLRTQVIHNDLNPYNILVCENPARISGIIDFGDMIRAPLVNELATAAAYQQFEDEPMAVLSDLVGSYHHVLPLVETELDLFLDLVRARQVMVVAITEWRAARHHANRDYITRNTKRTWRSLERLSSLSRSQTRQRLREACGVERTNG